MSELENIWLGIESGLKKDLIMHERYLESESVKDEINKINNYLEGLFNSKLSKEYRDNIQKIILNEIDVSDEVYYYTYCNYVWNLFNGFSRASEFIDLTTYSQQRLKDGLITINMEVAKKDLTEMIYQILFFIVEFELSGGQYGIFYPPSAINPVSVIEQLPVMTIKFSKTPMEISGNKISKFNYLFPAIIGWYTRAVIKDLKLDSITQPLREYHYNDKVFSEKVELQSKVIKEVDEIQKKLDGYKSQYNFVLLSKAFSNLKDEKEKELDVARRKMQILAAYLFFIPILFSVCVAFNITPEVFKDISGWKLLYYIPFITIEILLFYFMRLYYSEVRSTDAQLSQIKLRLSLCEFIHDYVEKRSENTESEEAWKVFETLIFSPIQMKAERIPSVLDGVDTIADIVGKVKGKGN